jgi:hypothetical protein
MIPQERSSATAKTVTPTARRDGYTPRRQGERIERSADIPGPAMGQVVRDAQPGGETRLEDSCQGSLFDYSNYFIVIPEYKKLWKLVCERRMNKPTPMISSQVPHSHLLLRKPSVLSLLYRIRPITVASCKDLTLLPVQLLFRTLFVQY